MKKCTKCEIELDLSEFGNTKKGKNGKNSICKKCHRAMGMEWRAKNEKKFKEYYKTYKRPGTKRVEHPCKGCGVIRVVQLQQAKKDKLCTKCFHNQPHIIEAKKNQSKFVSDEAKAKMSKNHWLKNGGVSPFKGKKHTQEVKDILSKKTKDYLDSLSDEEMRERYIKSSCGLRKVPVEDFVEFVTPEHIKERQSPEGKEWRKAVMKKGNYTCDMCGDRKELCAHHLNAFGAYPEERIDVDNGICLCVSCHKQFHSEYGNGHNTKEQYEEFKKVYDGKANSNW